MVTGLTPDNIIEIGFSGSWGYNLENMKEYEITEKNKIDQLVR